MTKKLIELLLKCGYRRILAGTLAYLVELQGKAITAKELERGVDARQPEISIALSQLAEKKWITVSKQETGAQGRPMLMYQLIPVEQLYQYIQKEQHLQIKTIQDTLNELRLAMIPAKVVSVPVESTPKVVQQNLVK